MAIVATSASVIPSCLAKVDCPMPTTAAARGRTGLVGLDVDDRHTLGCGGTQQAAVSSNEHDRFAEPSSEDHGRGKVNSVKPAQPVPLYQRSRHRQHLGMQLHAQGGAPRG